MPDARPPALSPRTLLALALLTLFWGLNWPVMKFSLRELTPLYFRALTMSGGVLFLLTWYRLSGASLALRSADVPRVFLLALPNVLGWHALSIFGVQELASGRAAILGFTMPIWAALLGVAVWGERMTARTGFALTCAAAAVALLLRHEFAALAGRPVGMAWMLGAAFCWALGTQLLRRTPLQVGTEALTVWMLGLSLPVLWSLAWVLEPAPGWEFSSGMWIALAYGFAINYGIAQIIWFTIARRLPPVASGLSILCVPLIGLGSAMWIVDERPHAEDYAAAFLIILALAVVLLWRGKPAALKAPARE